MSEERTGTEERDGRCDSNRNPAMRLGNAAHGTPRAMVREDEWKTTPILLKSVREDRSVVIER